MVHDNYTKVPNRLLEALALAQLKAREIRVLLVIWRETLGFSRHVTALSRRRIAGKAGAEKSNVRKALRILEDAKMIKIDPAKGRSPAKIRPVMDPGSWRGQGSAGPPLEEETGVSGTPLRGSVGPPSQGSAGPPYRGQRDPLGPSILKKGFKERVLNKPLKKPGGSPAPPVPPEEAFALALLLRDSIKAYKKNFKEPSDSALDSWAGDADLMIRVDHRDPNRIREMIDWTAKDDFWKTNILSVRKLRKHFDTIELQMEKNPGGRNGKSGEGSEKYRTKTGGWKAGAGDTRPAQSKT